MLTETIQKTWTASDSIRGTMECSTTFPVPVADCLTMLFIAVWMRGSRLVECLPRIVVWRVADEIFSSTGVLCVEMCRQQELRNDNRFGWVKRSWQVYNQMWKNCKSFWGECDRIVNKKVRYAYKYGLPFYLLSCLPSVCYLPEINCQYSGIPLDAITTETKPPTVVHHPFGTRLARRRGQTHRNH